MFLEIEEGQLIYFERFQYLFKLYLNLFASKSNRRNGYGNQKNVWPWNKSNCSWYHNWLISHNYGMHTLKFAMHMILYFFVSQTTLEVELWCYCSQFDFLLHWIESVNQEQEIFQKKKLIWCGLWAITLFQTVRTHLHQCCLCTARAVKETSVIVMQRTPRLDLPSGNRCHVGRAWQNIFWMWVTPFFVPDAACHVCCDVQVFNRCQSPGSSDIFQSPSGPIPKQLYVFNWYFVIFFCTIPHPVEKKLHQCQLQRHRQRNIYNKAIEQNSFVATNHAGSKKTLQI